jgi:phage/conjugal plasmid C-4 type zinc finger TraR family protein
MDDIDRAQAIENEHRAAALRRAVERGAAERPLIVAGVRICADCEDPIPPERIAALPHVVRCWRCQTLFERSA